MNNGSGRSKNKQSKQKNRRKTKRKSAKTVLRYSNFVAEAGAGCYIARRDSGGRKKGSPDWFRGWEDVDPEDFGFFDDDGGGEDEEAECSVPDIALDPEDFALSVCNIHNYTKVAYVTVFETAVIGANGVPLTQGRTTDNDGQSLPCVTFIVLCPPRVFAHLCYLGVSSDDELLNVRIESDVSRWKQHPDPSDEHPNRLGFPLNCNNRGGLTAVDPTKRDSLVSFLCTQGEGGELTHFFSGNLHAIDFRCPIGTELLAVADGIVIEAKDENTLTGIAVTNLFQWNSILLEIQIQNNNNNNNNNNTGDGVDADPGSGGNEEGSDRVVIDGHGHRHGPLFVEYVHISKSIVRAGDRVKRGQVIGYSGGVGFSPEPHLHFSAFRSRDAQAPTVRVLFDNCESDAPSLPFLPQAGKWYDANGIADDPASRCK